MFILTFIFLLGTFRFGRIDVTEAQVTIILSHILTAVFGDKLWHLKVSVMFHTDAKIIFIV